MDNYNINYDFFNYLNRHINGLVKIGNAVNSVSFNFEDLEHFGKGVLRFYINVEINDFESLTKEEQITANKYFYNSEQVSGSKYYSLTYKPSNSGIDLDEINQFSYFYSFAIQIIKNIIANHTDNCFFSYKNLLDDPLFKIINRYLEDTKPEFYRRDFEKKYSKLYNRIFEFDKMWYLKLQIKSKDYTDFKFEEILREDELQIKSIEINELLRLFLIQSNTPFKFLFNDNIIIDKSSLKHEINITHDESFKVLLQHLKL